MGRWWRPQAAGRVALIAAIASLAGPIAPVTGSEGPPSISAPEAILVQPATREVVFARRPHERRPIASTTKLMTALLVLERVSLDDAFTARAYNGIAAESRIGLRAGERMKVRDLLRALLLESANDAAQTLAEGTAGSSAAFVELMNQRARQLGLTDTHYANPIGLDEPGNYSSAADLVTLTLRLRRNGFFRRTVAMPSARLVTGGRSRVVDNRNDLVGRRPFVDGVKTGHTLEAGYVLIGSATRSGVSVVSVVLGDPSEEARDADSVALLDYGLSRFRTWAALRRDEVLATAAVRHRERDRVGLVPERSVTRVLRRGQRGSLRLAVPRRLEGPMPAGARVGSANVVVGGRVVQRVGVLTAAPVPHVGLAERAVGIVLKPGTLGAIAVVAAAAAMLAVGRRRRARAGES